MSRFIPVEPEKWGEMVKAWAENPKLKAEVERLTKHDDDTCRHFIMRTLLEAQNGFLNARVERLTKAGDAMADEIVGCFNAEGYDPADSDALTNWYAAKEGKQP
jgi:hypothetical protein